MFELDKCYCGKNKKKIAKTCVHCSNYINVLRSRSKYDTDSGRLAKEELDNIFKEIENFLSKK